MCLDNISKYFTFDNMKRKKNKKTKKQKNNNNKKKKTGLNGSPVDCNAINTSNILDIHRYLMKEI